MAVAVAERCLPRPELPKKIYHCDCQFTDVGIVAVAQKYTKFKKKFSLPTDISTGIKLMWKAFQPGIEILNEDYLYNFSISRTNN